MEVVESVAEQRFRALYEAHYAAIATYARRRVGDELATDVAAEVFLVAWRRLDEVPPEPLAWLYGVARRVVANQRRSTERLARLVERVSVNAAHTSAMLPSELEQSVTAGSVIASAFNRLSDDDREVLALVAWEGLGARELATVLECSVPAVTMRLHRARRRLRDHLQAASEEA